MLLPITVLAIIRHLPLNRSADAVVMLNVKFHIDTPLERRAFSDVNAWRCYITDDISTRRNGHAFTG